MVTEKECREFGLDEATIASMAEKGFFEPANPIEERRDDLTSEIEEVTDEIEQWESEVAELQEQLSKGRVKLARLRCQLGKLPPPAPEADDE